MIWGYLYFSVDDKLLKDIIIPGSELLERLVLELDREENSGLKTWTHLALKWEIPAEVLRVFAVQQMSLIKLKSPSKKVLEWVAAQFPEITLSDVAKALDEIQRNDAVQIISEYFPVGKYSLK